MFQEMMPMTQGGGGGVTSIIGTHIPTYTDANILDYSFAVDIGKTYIITGQIGDPAGTYTVTGGEIISQQFESTKARWGNNYVRTVVIVFKATASSITITVSGGYTAGLYGGMILEVGLDN